jgi:hypothetical protein
VWVKIFEQVTGFMPEAVFIQGIPRVHLLKVLPTGISSEDTFVLKGGGEWDPCVNMAEE